MPNLTNTFLASIKIFQYVFWVYLLQWYFVASVQAAQESSQGKHWPCLKKCCSEHCVVQASSCTKYPGLHFKHFIACETISESSSLEEPEISWFKDISCVGEQESQLSGHKSGTHSAQQDVGNDVDFISLSFGGIGYVPFLQGGHSGVRHWIFPSLHSQIVHPVDQVSLFCNWAVKII